MLVNHSAQLVIVPILVKMYQGQEFLMLLLQLLKNLMKQILKCKLMMLLPRRDFLNFLLSLARNLKEITIQISRAKLTSTMAQAHLLFSKIVRSTDNSLLINLLKGWNRVSHISKTGRDLPLSMQEGNKIKVLTSHLSLWYHQELILLSLQQLDNQILIWNLRPSLEIQPEARQLLSDEKAV
jgi:hypothetical protein